MDARSLPETLTFLLGIENVARGEPPLIIAAGGTIGPVANSIWPGIHNPGASGEPRQVSIQVPVLHPMLCLVSEPKPKVYTQDSGILQGLRVINTGADRNSGSDQMSMEPEG